MVKHNLNDIFSDLNSESSIIMPKSIKIKNIKSVDTISDTTSSFMPQKGGYLDATSSFMPQKGGYLDATSSFMPQKGGYSDATSSFMPQKGGYSDATSSFMPQKGGYLDATSSFMPQKGGYFTSSNKKNNKDIKQLISMLSPTSESNYTANNTDTEQLRDELFNILKTGGSPPLSESGPISDHTHIIYACCLVDINVVNKIKYLMDNTPKKKYRVYINCNPFNIFGIRIPGGVFGEESYNGIIELHRLFRESNILNTDSWSKDTILTYDLVCHFINTLKDMNIILIDAGDYIIKSWLIEKQITLEEAMKVVSTSQLIPEPEKQKKINTFLIKRNNENKPIKIPFEWYETYLPKIPFEHINETYAFDKLKNQKEPIPANFTFINNIIRAYERDYINKLQGSNHKYEPIRIFEHKRLLTQLLEESGLKEPTKQDEKNILLQILENPDVNVALKKFPQFISNKNFLIIFQKWVSSLYFQQKSPKVLFDFVGFLFICINGNGNIDDLIIENKIMEGNLVARVFNTEKLQKMIKDKCTEQNKENPHAAVLPLIENIKLTHTQLSKVTLIIDCESDDLLTTIVCKEYLPKDINLDVIIQKNKVDVEFETVNQYLDNLTIYYQNQENIQKISEQFDAAIKDSEDNLKKVKIHEQNSNTVITELEKQLTNFIENIVNNEKLQVGRTTNITHDFIIEESKINLRFILSNLERHLTLPVYFDDKQQVEIRKKLVDKDNYQLLSDLTKNININRVISQKSPLQFKPLSEITSNIRQFVGKFKEEILIIANNEYQEEIKKNKEKLKEIFQNHIQIIYPFIKKDIITMFIKFIDNRVTISSIQNFCKILNYQYINNIVLELITEFKTKLKNVKFKEQYFQDFCTKHNIPIDFINLYNLYNFFIDEFKKKYKDTRTTYSEIDLDFYKKINHIKQIIKNITHEELIFEFFTMDKSNISILQKVPENISLSPNILKVADTLLHLLQSDDIKTNFDTYKEIEERSSG